ncbi:transmembrane protein 254 [Elgaria multicarinata webbii]|uniref:transmembrane protein 254 n=1 Tax=Elgaria multicarinata webbii TaxID=159646 RepID=UPI002FCD0839
MAAAAAASSAHDWSRRPSSSSSSSPSTYFQRASPFWMVLIAAGMSYYGWAVISPSTIPYDYLGPLATLTKYLVKNHNIVFQLGYVIAWMVHVWEAFYALKLCKTKGITDFSTQLWWFVQTFLFGVASLHYLLQYEPQRKHE